MLPNCLRPKFWVIVGPDFTTGAHVFQLTCICCQGSKKKGNSFLMQWILPTDKGECQLCLLYTQRHHSESIWAKGAQGLCTEPSGGFCFFAEVILFGKPGAYVQLQLSGPSPGCSPQPLHPDHFSTWIGGGAGQPTSHGSSPPPAQPN